MLSLKKLVTLTPEELAAVLDALRRNPNCIDVSEGGVNFHLAKETYNGATCWLKDGDDLSDLNVFKLATKGQFLVQIDKNLDTTDYYLADSIKDLTKIK